MPTRSRRRQTVKPPIREWLPKIQIGRAYRPGYGMDHAVIPPEVVSEWIIGIKAMEARSVICLLSKPELEWYSHLPGGLLGTYQAAGLDAVSIPVPMDPGELAAKHLKRLEEAFVRLPKPVVIHCHAGLVRSGAAVAHLVANHSRLTTDMPTPMEASILRLIRNSKREHSIRCALRSGGYGLADYGLLAHRLAGVPDTILGKYLDEVDGVRRSHLSCISCSLKFLAFCKFFSTPRLPQRNAEYQTEFQQLLREDRSGRDFMGEIQEVIQKAAHQDLGPGPN